MNNRIRNINGKYSRNGFDDDLFTGNDDSALFESVGEYIKGRLDLEDVKNDPALSTTMETVKEMVSDYNRKKFTGNKDNEKFVRDIFSDSESTNKLNNEIKVIKQEIDDKNLNLITSEWVKEWHEKKQKLGATDPRSEERRNFITESINSSSENREENSSDGKDKSIPRRLFVKYAALSAAALLGAFMVIRTLLPSSDPQELFSSYYKPFDAVSPVTRSINNNENNQFSSAISNYKTANYSEAAAGFTTIASKDPSSISARFYLGLTQLALNNYSESIQHLSVASKNPGEYTKDIQWYLGLAYLKNGDKEKAIESFQFLARSNGFYKERAGSILRRLK
jgi:TolA-binding protein